MNDLIVKPLHIADRQQLEQLRALYQRAFSPWYPRIAGRRIVNLIAATFPECFLQVERSDSKYPLGYLFSIPVYWNGVPSSLDTFDAYTVDRFRGNSTWLAEIAATVAAGVLTPASFRWPREHLREILLSDANTIMLIAMIIQPEQQRLGTSKAFFDYVKQHSCPALGFKHVVGPFRPSGFGSYKVKAAKEFSFEDFSEYCQLVDEEGFPQDPWLRSVAKNGFKFSHPEIRSARVTRPLTQFDKFKRNFKTSSWREISSNVWECGEVPTWFVDPNRKLAYSLEPNYWGYFSHDDTSGKGES